MPIKPCVLIVDDDVALCERLRLIVESAGFRCQTYVSAEEFLEKYDPKAPSCLILDVYLPGLSGPELQSQLNKLNMELPIIFLTAYGDIPMAVRSIKAGAVDFLAKPVADDLLMERVQEALRQHALLQNQLTERESIIESLTPREKEIMQLAISGLSNKEIARKFNISIRTVENHRRKILKKTKRNNFFELVQLYETAKKPA